MIANDARRLAPTVIGPRPNRPRLLGPRLVGVLAVALTVLLSGRAVDVAAEAAPRSTAVRQTSCGYAPTAPLSQVRFPAIREASALVASQQWPGTYWTLNDSKNAPMLFALDEGGQARGAFQVGGATNVDWEALQLGPDGAGGSALYIGDIGDNLRQRRDGVIYRIPEPEPAGPGMQAARPTEPAVGFHFRFPVWAENVEAMLVHPKTGEILMFSRASTGYSLAYSMPMLTDSEHSLVPEFVDLLDVGKYDGNRSPLGSTITDGAVSPDAKHVALRTYTSVLLFDLADGASLGTIVTQEPRVYPIADSSKGEGITFRADSSDLLTIGEGTPATLFETAWQC
jgi:hypothetical protein